MNDRKFLGLLNLYLDGEIDRDSASALEREILSNPRRREVYSEYCRIHRATKLVYERFRVAATEHGYDGAHDALRQNVFSTENDASVADAGRGPVRTVAYWLGGVAAACAAVWAVFLYAPRAGSSNTEAPVAVAPPSEQQQRPASQSQPQSVAAAPIPAPFAAETRLDPFMPERAFQRRSPFTFSTESTRNPSYVSFDTTPAPAFYWGTSAENAQPNFRGLALESKQVDTEDSRVFRQTSDGEPVEFEPVGFQIQR